MKAGDDDTRHIERDLEDTRARLDATLDALQQKLSPGQMVDEAMSWFKDGDGVEFGRNIGRSVRDNPIPVALIGIGLGWLMIGGGREQRDERWVDDDLGESRYPSRRGYGGYGPAVGSAVANQPQPYAAAAYDDLAGKARDAGARVQRATDESEDTFKERVYAAQGAVVGVTKQVGEALSAYGERVERALEAAGDRFRQAGQGIGDASGRTIGQAGDIASDALNRGRSGLRSLYGYGQTAAYSARDGAGQVVDNVRDASTRTASYLKDQPLLMGVVGLTVGAVLGMLIPPTRYEREIAGDLRRSLGEQAREAAGDLGQRAARVAETMLDTAHEAAQREGLTGMSPGDVAANAREQVASTARGARKVVEETIKSGEDALKGEAEGASQRAEQDRTIAAGAGDHGDRRPFA